MSTIQIITVGLILGLSMLEVSALDAPPPPDPVTLQWTLEQARCEIPIVSYVDVPLERAFGYLSSSMRMPGYYLDLDLSRVTDRLDIAIDLELKKTDWLTVISILADKIEADVLVSPARVTLVPREPKEVEKQ